jgi:septum formation protein
VPSSRKPTGLATVHSFHETTMVTFASVSDDEVAAYVATAECFDKAGSYGVQGPAAMWVSGLKGCYFNVMGFPLHRFAAALQDMVEAGTVTL